MPQSCGTTGGRGRYAPHRPLREGAEHSTEVVLALVGRAARLRVEGGQAHRRRGGDELQEERVGREGGRVGCASRWVETGGWEEGRVPHLLRHEVRRLHGALGGRRELRAGRREQLARGVCERGRGGRGRTAGEERLAGGGAAFTPAATQASDSDATCWLGEATAVRAAVRSGGAVSSKPMRPTPSCNDSHCWRQRRHAVLHSARTASPSPPQRSTVPTSSASTCEMRSGGVQ